MKGKEKDMTQTRQIQGSTQIIGPVEVGEAMLTPDVKIVSEARNSLLRRVNYLQGRSDNGEGNMPSPGREPQRIDDDLIGSYGQLNALNSRLSGLSDSPAVIPYDGSGAVGKVFQPSGLLTPEALGILNTIPNEPARQMILRALYEVGTFASSTTKHLSYASRPRVNALRGPIEQRSFRTVSDTIGKAAKVELSDDAALKARKKFIVTKDDLAAAKKFGDWNADLEATLKDLMGVNRISVVDAPTPGAKGGIDGQIEDIEAKIMQIDKKADKTMKDRLRLADLRKDLADKKAQKVR